MCQGQVGINSKKLPLDTRTYHPIFLKMRVFLPNHITGSSICHFTRIAGISLLRQGENNLQEGACSFDMCSGQIRHQSLTFPANALPGCCSNHNVLSCAAWPCVPLSIAGCHCGLNPELPSIPAGLCRTFVREKLSWSIIFHSRQQTFQPVTASHHSSHLVSCIWNANQARESGSVSSAHCSALK